MAEILKRNIKSPLRRPCAPGHVRRYIADYIPLMLDWAGLPTTGDSAEEETRHRWFADCVGLNRSILGAFASGAITTHDLDKAVLRLRVSVIDINLHLALRANSNRYRLI